MSQILSERVRVALVQHLFICAREHGLPCQVMLEGSGLDPKQLKDPQAEVPAFHVQRMLETAAALSGDRLLGLQLARHAQLDGFGVLGQRVRVSRTVQDALDAVLAYGHLAGTPGRVWMERKPGRVLLCMQLRGGDRHYQRQATELLLAAMVRCMREQLVDPTRPLLHRVYFHHPLPEGVMVEHYRPFFSDAEVHFNHPFSALEIPSAVLSEPLLHADASMRELIDQLAAQLLSRSADFSLLELAGSKLRTLLREGRAGREPLAAELGFSVRQMNRQLQVQGYSYRSLLDQIQREEAMRLLRESDLEVVRIARQFNYSTSQAFIRWFKRTVGVTPQCYRQGQR